MYRAYWRVAFFSCIVAFSISAEAAENPAQVVESEAIKEAIKSVPNITRDECIVRSKAIQDDAIALQQLLPEELAKGESDEDYLFRVYLRTNKFDDKGCFEWKDLAAAKRLGMRLKEYVIEGIHPVLRQRLAKLFRLLEKDECAPGIKCLPGITSGFRDDFRQEIAEGFKAGRCRSFHGGSCKTAGWGDGRAVDAVNVSPSGTEENEFQARSRTMWKLIDKHRKVTKVFRPMPGYDPMHLQPSDDLPVIRKALLKNKKKPEQPAKKPIKKRHKQKKEQTPEIPDTWKSPQ